MKPLIALLFVTLLMACGPNKPLVTKEKFVDRCVAELENKYHTFTFTKMPGTGILITSQSGKEYQINTEELYDLYKASPDSLNKFVEQSLKDLKISSFDPMSDDAFTIDDILPVVKSASYSNAFSEAQRRSLVLEKYNDSLYLLLMIVKDNMMTDLSQRRMKSLDMEYFKVKAIAMGNMEKHVKDLQEIKLVGHVSMITTGSLVDASIIFLSQIWRKKEIEVNGDYVISIPNSNAILVTGSKDKEGLETMRKLTDKALKKLDHPVAAGFFRFDGEQFQPYR